jgi:hypothetical protein
MSKKKGLHCPQCGTYLDLPAQVKELDELYGDDVDLSGGGFPWFSTITCPKCDDQTVLIDIEAAGESEEVYSPALKSKVKIPRIMRGQN